MLGEKPTIPEVKNIFSESINRLGMAEKESVIWKIDSSKETSETKMQK